MAKDKFNNKKLEREFNRNSSSNSSRKYIDNEFKKNLNNMKSNNMKKLIDNNNPLKAIKEVKDNRKEQFKKLTETGKDLSKEALKSTKRTLKTGETIIDKGALNKSSNLDGGTMDMGDDFDFSSFDDFDMSDENSDNDEIGDFSFDDFDEEESNKSEVISSTTVINDNSSSAKSSALLTSSISNLSQINATGFNNLMETLHYMRETNDNVRENLFEGLTGLIKTSNDIRNNTSVKNISEIKNSNSLEDLFLSNITLSNILSGSKEDSFKDKAKDFAKKQGIELVKDIIESRTKGIQGGLLDSAKGKAFDIINSDKISEKLTNMSTVFTKDENKEDKKKTNRDFIDKQKSKLIDKLFNNIDGGISTANKKNKNERVAFDVETHSTINTVIPGYLSKIVGLTSEDGQEIHYDYDSGSFKTSKTINDEIKKSIDKTIENSEFFKRVESKAKDKNIDSKDYKSLVKNIISENVNSSKDSDKVKTKSSNVNSLLEELFEDKEVKTSLTKARMQLNQKSKSIRKNLGGSTINAVNDKGQKPKSYASKGNNEFSDINFNIINSDISEIKNIVSRINDKLDVRKNNQQSSQNNNIVSGDSQKQDSKFNEIKEKLDDIKDTKSSNSSNNGNNLNNRDEQKSTLIPDNNEAHASEVNKQQEEKEDNPLKDEIKDKIEEKAKDKIKDIDKDKLKRKVLDSKIANTKIGKKAIGAGGSVAGKVAASGALFSGAGRELRSKLRNKAKGKFGASKAGSKLMRSKAGKGIVKAGLKVGSRVGLAATGVGLPLSILLSAPEIMSTIAHPIESLKHPIKTLGSFIGFNDHPAKQKKEQEKLDSEQPNGENAKFGVDPLVDSKLTGDKDSSSLIGGFIKDNPLLAQVPLMGLAGVGLYKGIVKPAFGLGMNMVQKTTGMAKGFGDSADSMMEEKSNGFGGLIKKAVGGASMLLMAPLAMAGKGISTMVGATSNLIQVGLSLTKNLTGFIYDKFLSHEEEMSEQSREMVEASKEELGSYQEGIEDHASERAKKEMAEMQGMSDKASKDAKKQVEDSTNKTKDNIEKDVNGVMKNSPLSIMGKISEKMHKMMPNNLMSKLKKAPKKLAETMLRLSPFYSLLSKKKKKKSKKDITDPDGEVVNKIGDWFDKLGGMMNDIMAGFMAGSSGSSSSEGSSEGGAESVDGKDVASKVWNFFAEKGLEDHQIAGILGNFERESKMDPGAEQNSGWVGGKGLAQWDDRKDKLKAFAEKKGKKWSDLDAQLDFMWYELQGSESAAWSAIKKAKNVDEATVVWENLYERAGVKVIPERQSNAKKWLDKLGGSSKKSTKAKGGGSSTVYSDTNVNQFANMVSSTSNKNKKVGKTGLVLEKPTITGGVYGKGGGSGGSEKDKIKQAVQWAIAQDGAKYSQSNRQGKNSFDCSSLIARSFKKAGLEMDINATTFTFRDGGTKFRKISKGTKKKIGDITLCDNDNHVTMYIGGGKQVESYYGHGVAVTPANKYQKMGLQIGITMRYGGGGPDDTGKPLDGSDKIDGSDNEGGDSNGSSAGASEYSFKNGTWYGSITGRDDNRMDEEEQEALNDRLMKRYARIYGIDYEEAKKIDEEQQAELKAKAGKEATESGASSGSSSSSDGSEGSSGKDGSDGKDGKDGSSSSYSSGADGDNQSSSGSQGNVNNNQNNSSIINNGGNNSSTVINNNYNNGRPTTNNNSITNQTIQGNNNTVRNIYNITNNYNNSKVNYENKGPMKVDPQKRMDLDNIIKHTSNIDKNTAKMLEQLKDMSFKGKNINKDGNTTNISNTIINNKGDLVDSKGNVIIKDIQKELEKIIKENPNIINNGQNGSNGSNGSNGNSNNNNGNDNQSNHNNPNDPNNSNNPNNPNDPNNPYTPDGSSQDPSTGNQDLQEAIRDSYGDRFVIDVRPAIPVFSGK
ncbi:tail lysin [Staphylococcus phage vB_StaM_PB50]|nr:tail lysin [Staphylococcus phage vB_StaM_PB50]